MTTTMIANCEWFALCDNRATTTRPGFQITKAGIKLQDVPICDRCAAKVDALDPNGRQK